jgi:hypothetical protein
MEDCLVCLYRQTFTNGWEFPIHYAYYHGLSLNFESEIPVCREHADWVADEFPDTLEPIMGLN